MPLDGTHPLLATVALIDGVLKLYGPEGEHWTQYHLDDGEGRHCLLGAMRRVRQEKGIRRDTLARYLATIERRATGESHGIKALNDDMEEFAEIRTVLLAAREIVMAKIEGRPEQPVDISSITYTPEQHSFSIKQLVEDLVAREIMWRH